MKKDYMARLERAARWRLPRQEAEDVIADYRDIVGTPPRPDEELLRDLGRPRDAVRPLAQSKQYRIWLAVFAALCACILIPGVSPHAFFYWIWDRCFAGPFTGYLGRDGHWGPILAGIGLIGALVWFRLQGHKGERLPKALPSLLAALALWCGAILLVDWLAMRDPAGFSAMWGEVPWTWFGIPIGPNGGMMVPRSVEYLKAFLQNGGTIAAFLGVFGLVRARTEDRRWAAAYALSMAVTLISMESLALFTSMDPSFDFSAGWYHAYLGYHAAATAIGLIGAGVALC